MRAFAFVSAASLALAAPAQAAPGRVASLNLCTDELLLLLGDAGQIASVSYLSQQPEESPLWSAARRYRGNDGSLMNVVALRPDLILSMGGGGRDRLGIAARIGIRTITLPYPAGIADVERDIATVAEAVGRPAAGAAVIARIEQLRRTAPAHPRDAIWLSGGGWSLAAAGLGAQWMRLAGFVQRPLTGDRVSLETLLVHPPQVLLRSDYRGNQYSLAQQWLRHPLASALGRVPTVTTDGRRWTCGGPLMIPEIGRLRRVAPR